MRPRGRSRARTIRARHHGSGSRLRSSTRYAKLRAKAHRVAELLAARYGSPRHDNKDDPLDELIFIVLSQMTTHWSFGRVFERLKADLPSWDSLLEVPIERVVALIKDAGLSGQKAPRLVAILNRLRMDFGRATLEPLRSMSSAKAQRYLTSLPGVGVKTAKCVMMYSLSRKVLPVDTHVWRVARRVGVVSEDVPYERVHEALELAVAPADRYGFHVNAIAHGRALCLAKGPRCLPCPVRTLCRYPRRRARWPDPI